MTKILSMTMTALLLLSTTGNLCAQEANPEDVIIKAFHESVEILKDPELQGSEKIKERRAALWQYLKPNFDLQEMSRRALGIHWKEISDQEKDNFMDVFTDILKYFYLEKIDTYSGEKFEYVRKIVKGNRAKLRTHIFDKNGEKYEFDISMKKNGKQWKAYDLSVEGISIINNYRNQFKNLLAKKSFAELMEQLHTKREEMRIEGL